MLERFRQLAPWLIVLDACQRHDADQPALKERQHGVGAVGCVVRLVAVSLAGALRDEIGSIHTDDSPPRFPLRLWNAGRRQADGHSVVVHSASMSAEQVRKSNVGFL